MCAEIHVNNKDNDLQKNLPIVSVCVITWMNGHGENYWFTTLSNIEN